MLLSFPIFEVFEVIILLLISYCAVQIHIFLEFFCVFVLFAKEIHVKLSNYVDVTIFIHFVYLFFASFISSLYDLVYTNFQW